ncbi:MAG: hypothetical protein QXT77_00045 [Candidatus Methanomethylicaceae archaeon]
MAEGQGITIELVNQWLSCDDDAGRQLWLEAINSEYREKIAEIGWDYVMSMGGVIRHNMTEREMQSHINWLLIYKLPNKLKPSDPKGGGKKRGKKPGDFKSVEEFRAYLDKAIHEIKSLIFKDNIFRVGKKPVESIEPFLSGQEGNLGTGVRRIKQALISPQPSPEAQVIADEDEKRRKNQLQAIGGMEGLLKKLREELSPALRKHFDTIVEKWRSECNSGEDLMDRLINFLCAHPHQRFPDLQEHFVNTLEVPQDTYNSYNRRIRARWKEILRKYADLLAQQS